MKDKPSDEVVNLENEDTGEEAHFQQMAVDFMKRYEELCEKYPELSSLCFEAKMIAMEEMHSLGDWVHTWDGGQPRSGLLHDITWTSALIRLEPFEPPKFITVTPGQLSKEPLERAPLLDFVSDPPFSMPWVAEIREKYYLVVAYPGNGAAVVITSAPVSTTNILQAVFQEIVENHNRILEYYLKLGEDFPYNLSPMARRKIDLAFGRLTGETFPTTDPPQMSSRFSEAEEELMSVEVDETLRAAGYDPEEVGKEMSEAADDAITSHPLYVFQDDDIKMARNEPPPEESDHDPVWKSLFMLLHTLGLSKSARTNWILHQMIVERIKFGEVKYGTQLRPFNGRDPIIDAYQELIDAMLYILQAGLENIEFEEQTKHWVMRLIEVSLGLIDVERRLDGNVENDELAIDQGRVRT